MKPTVLQAFKHRAGAVSLVMFAWASFVPVGRISAISHRLKSQPVISVGVYNYAGLGRLQLQVAEHQVAALFAKAGVRIAWLEYSSKHLPASSGEPAPDFSVRILNVSRILRARRISGTDALGQSIMAPAGTQWTVPGRIANVFYDRVEHVSSLWGLFRGEVMGNAIAHELGHLLLGPQHSHRGIMKADWTPQDLALSSRGQLRFSAKQAVELRRAARSLHKNLSLSVTAQR
ncbi:MAG TPA: hypothetical protein VNM47_13950 [Terriglobia bacterium]|nr:hypothetical protein [Terriglobia bacterium]